MLIEFDPHKDAINIAKHGMSFADAARFEWDSAVISMDLREDYGEDHQVAWGFIDPHLCVLVFVETDEACRVISLRKATNQEKTQYARIFNAS